MPDTRDVLLLDANALSRQLAVSVSCVRRMDAGGRLPRAIRFGGNTRWRADEIREWIAAGCPSRKTWEADR